ncbi:fish-egg lectin-like [Neosynchiropus ocellatus]
MKTAIALLLLSCVLAASHAFRCEEAPRYYSLGQIEAGHGIVVASTRYQAIMLTGTRWSTLSNRQLIHVSVGPSGLWGTDRSYKLYKMVGGSFVEAQGLKMKMVESGGDDFVMGIRSSDSRTVCIRGSSASRYRGVGSVSWVLKPNVMKQISCGGKKCWAVDAQNRVYVMWNINSGCGSTSWVQVTGTSLKMVTVGEDGSVFGVMPNGVVCERRGISNSNPRGSSWTEFPMCIAVDRLTYDLGRLWISSRSGLLLECRR